MTTQSFPLGDAPRVVISNCRGDLEIVVWDERAIEVDCANQIGHAGPSDEAFIIQGATGDLLVHVPADAEVIADDIKGDVSAHDFRTLSLTNVGGDVEISDLSSVARVERAGGDVQVRQVEALALAGKISGDVSVKDVNLVEIEQMSGDLDLQGGRAVTVDNLGGDCSVECSESFRYGNIGGELEFQGGARAVLAGGSVGGDCVVHSLASAQLGDIGGDCAINEVAGELRLGSVGGDCTINQVAGEIRLGSVGGDAAINAESAGARIGNVGGDLNLASAFPAGSKTGVTVGGDATIDLPRDASLALRATVGGDVSGERLVGSGGGMFTAVYGDGAAQLDLIVGGDLALHGGGVPRSSSSSRGWGEFGEQLGHMGEELGREFSKMGADLERELSGMFGAHGKHSSDKWARKVQQRVEEQVQRAEERAQRASEAARRHAGAASGRMHVRINDREWRFDAERLEGLKQQARDAAREGVSGAIAAMERALAGLGVPPEPPRAPSASVAPEPPRAPSAPSAPAAAAPAQPPQPPATGQTIRIGVAPPAAASDSAPAEYAPEPARNIEEERAAILQMIAEGRISPEEGDMLLDALGS